MSCAWAARCGTDLGLDFILCSSLSCALAFHSSCSGLYIIRGIHTRHATPRPPRPVDADADMPPLVDAPTHAQTQQSMMSSFEFDSSPSFAPAGETQGQTEIFDFTHVSFAGSERFAPTTVLPTSSSATTLEGAVATRGRGRGSTKSGGTAHAANYIPRPPNAFILFRSSFIRSQNVPGRVEGNHSTLSKIIGG